MKSGSKGNHKRSSTTLSASKTAAKSAASRKSNANGTPSTQAGFTANKNSHGKEYLGSNQQVFGGPGNPMDSNMYKSQQAPEVQNFQEPKYVKEANLTASNQSKYTTPARAMTQSQMLKTHAFQPDRNKYGTVDPLGPGKYDVERSLDFTKPRSSSPDIGRVVDRQSPARADTISPDQYDPNHEFVQYENPKWTIGPKHGPALDEQDEDMVNYATNAGKQGAGYGFDQQESLVAPSSKSKARPKSTMNKQRRPNNSKTQKGRGVPDFGELDSYNEPPKFGSSAKGVATFGAPKKSAATTASRPQRNSRRSSMQNSKTTAPTRGGKGAPDDGMSMMTAVVFEEEAGPDVQEEEVTKVRDVSREKATKSARPTNTAQATPKKVQLKSSIGSKPASKKRVPQSGMGPGHYDPSTATKQTHARSKTALIGGGKTGRPDINMRTQPGTGDLGPGAYDDGRGFGKDVKGHGFGKPKPQRTEVDDRDYGVDPEKVFKQTRHRSPAAIINKHTPARPGSFAMQGAEDAQAPGKYDTGKKFGEGVKSLGFGKPKPEKIEKDDRDYGMDPENEFKATRTRSPAAIINKHTPARPQSFALQTQSAGPGQYDTGREFGKNLKNMTFDKTQRTKPIEETTGPGQYDPDRATSVTKTRVPSAYIAKDKARPDSFAPKSAADTGGPGQYEPGPSFGQGVKSHGFGVAKTPKKIVVDNRDYDVSPERDITKSRSKAATFSKTPARPSSFAKSGDVNVAPGQYDDGKRFNSGVKGFKIVQEKRPTRQVESIGPGAYDLEIADKHTKPKMPNITMGASPSRPGTFAKTGDVDVAPGQYDDGKRFNSDVKGFRIAEKRPERVVETMGPGAYDPDLADRHTKPKMPNITMGGSPSRPQSFARGGDVNVAPGQYDDGKRFNSDVKGFKIAEKRPERRVETMGPGAYDPDLADKHTKPKIANINLGSSPSRPGTFAKSGDVDVAPGQYDDGIRFNSNVKGFKIAEKRPERMTETIGPGAYDPDLADRHTKPKMPNITMGGSPSRPQSFAKGGDVDVAPGQYDDGKRFNSGVKGFKIGEKREQRTIETMGPGAYDPDLADKHTKQKIPNINLGSSPSRPGTFAKSGDVDVAPGQYDDGIRFNSNVKGFKIAEKRPERASETIGPGAYDPDLADRHTKPKMPNITMGGSPSRPQSFAKGGDIDVAPGQYDDGKRFNSDVKGFKIGEKRETRTVETMGPGAYDPDLADKHTKQKIPNINLGSSPSRPGTFAKTGDVDVAPGQYDDGIRFNSNVKGFKIAEKRPERTTETIGPGAYDPDLADRHTKPKMPNITMGATPSRPDSFAKGGDVDVAPGQYDDGKRFNSDVKGFKIGEKREPRTVETMGPGAYDPDLADKHTKQKIPNINLGSSPSRPGTFAKSGDLDVAPGQYDDGIRFNSGVKGFTIAEKREQRTVETMGPGAYDPDLADNQTKPKMPNINLGSSPSRPGTFAKTGDVDVAPGQYDDGIRFNSNVKGFKIAEKRESRTVETMGPGAYDPDKADGIIKPKMPNITMGATPSRPDSFAKGGDVDVAPGQYDDGKRFNSDVKGFKIGEKREPRTVETMGPGAYDPELADKHTKQKTPNINLGSSPSRPGTFAKTGDVDVAPGQYDDGREFGKDVKSFTIAPEKPEARLPESMGPGAYDPDRADGQTKKRIPNINMGTTPSRPHSLAKPGDVDVAPGQYDDGRQFGKDVKGFTIPEKREPRPQSDNLGPGAYDPDRADGQTKPKMPTVNLASSPTRPGLFNKHPDDANVAPGQYDTGKEFGKDVKGFTIAEKRDPRPQSDNLGPGAYDPDRADGQTKPKMPNVNLGSSPSRPASNAQNPEDGHLAPGTYDDNSYKFGNNVNGFKIGEKREKPIADGMGPGSYDPDKADGLTKPKMPNTIFGASPERRGDFGQFGQEAPPEPRKNENLQSSKRRPDSKKAIDPYQNLKPKEPTSKLMKPVRTNTRQSEESGRASKKSSGRRGSKATMVKQSSIITTTNTKVVNGQIVSQDTSVKKNVNISSSLAVTKQKSSTNSRTSKKVTATKNNTSSRLANLTLGPGDYDVARSDSVTKTRSPGGPDFRKTTGRQESPSRDESPDFMDQERFYNYPKEIPNYTIGEKRPEKPKEGPGPGEYNLDDSAIKPRTPGKHQF